MEWKDVTSYRQSVKKKVPTSFELKIGNFRVILVWNHFYVPDEWSTSIYEVYENYTLGLTSYEDIEEAKVLARSKAIHTFESALKDLKQPCTK